MKQQVQELYNSGLGARKIAARLNVTRWAVQQIYKQLGIFNPKRIFKKPIPKEKPCKICIEIKPIEQFRKREEKGRISYEPYCLICEDEYRRKRGKQKYKENPQLWVEYKAKNIERIRANERERYKDPKYRLRKFVSGNVRGVLQNKKNASISKYLPYTIEELKSHIEKQFESWMNWENQGKYIVNEWDDNNTKTWKWQIDHIMPQSDLPYKSMEDENFKICWALSNLRPLSAKQNLIDGTTRIRHNK